MSDSLALHVLRRSDVDAASIYSTWVDGDQIARPREPKRAMMLDNPMSTSPDDPFQIIGTKGNRVIGRIDLIAGRLLVDNVPAPILWGSEYFVRESDRTTMMGAMLLLRWQQLFHTLGAYGVSQMAHPLYAKLKWIDVPHQRYIILRKSGPVVRRYVRNSLAAAAAHRLVDIGLLAHKAYLGVVRSRAAGDLVARKLEQMPMELDQALRPASPLVRGYRGVDWMNWVLRHRFSDEFRHERHLYLVHAKGASDPVGYFMLKVKFFEVATSRSYRNLTLASLVDAMAFDQGRCSHSALVNLALREAFQLNVDALELTDKPGHRASFYRSLGGIPAGLMHLMVRAAKPSPIADPAFREPAKWDFQLGDGEYIPN